MGGGKRSQGHAGSRSRHGIVQIPARKSEDRRLVVQIVDVGTREVVSQIPSKDVLEMESRLAKLGSGAGSPQPSLTAVDTTA